MEKIKSNKAILGLNIVVFIGWLMLFALAIYTRIIQQAWGLPYPFHPDERNMAVAIQQLGCPGQPGWTFLNCFNPHFFAYGQLPLYLGYLLIVFKDMYINNTPGIDFNEAVMSLRIISAAAGVGTVIMLVESLRLMTRLHGDPPERKQVFVLFISTLFVFSPVLIQFAHYGTTESALMFLYMVLVYISLRAMHRTISLKNYTLLCGIVTGIAVAIKVSSLVYCMLPVFIIARYAKGDTVLESALERFFQWVRYGAIVLFFAIMLSPFNILSYDEFIGSMHYESDVGLGKALVFYTRQFFLTTPILFQFIHIFPYTLGWGVLLLFLIALIWLPFKQEHRVLRISFLIVFIPNAFIYAKWSRFVSPAYPVMILTAAYFVYYIVSQLSQSVSQAKPKISNSSLSLIYGVICILIVLSIIPGIAYLSIYKNPDVRYAASDWIYMHVPNNSYILAETANVVDIPIPDPSKPPPPWKNYQYKSFNFYDLDIDPVLQNDLADSLRQADYIFVPSRRIFMNHTCLQPADLAERPMWFITDSVADSSYEKRCDLLRSRYPRLYQYYSDLFSGRLGFTKVAEFSSYPTLSMFGTQWEFPDELAEETWTVFDHPVIRIYKKNTSSTL